MWRSGAGKSEDGLGRLLRHNALFLFILLALFITSERVRVILYMYFSSSAQWTARRTRYRYQTFMAASGGYNASSSLEYSALGAL
jgi:hypothetical protein